MLLLVCVCFKKKWIDSILLVLQNLHPVDAASLVSLFQVPLNGHLMCLSILVSVDPLSSLVPVNLQPLTLPF